MPVGSKFKFFIPSALAYGEAGSPPNIEPNSALAFEVELLDIVTPEAAPTPPAPAPEPEPVPDPAPAAE